MHRVFLAIRGCIVLTILVATPIIQAQEVTVRIQHYTHAGCEFDGYRYLPAGADSGLVATFRYPEGTQQCLAAINRMQAGCQMATHFQATSPHGHPWSTGEKDPRCLQVFMNEIPNCIQHYESQKPKCQGPQHVATVIPFGPNWIIVTNQPCQIYNPYPKPGESATWSGDCVNGKASGEGQTVWRDGDGESVYQGGRRDGKVHGRGTYTYSDGGRYEGEWRDDKRDGQGTHSYSDGGRYEGEWRAGKQHGRGTATYADGSRYEGEWRDDKQHGKGTATYADGNRYEGMYSSHKRHGQGNFMWSNSDRYEGQWHNNLRHGYGVIVLANGKHYEGQWRNDKPHGYGGATIDGDRYEGTWTEGCFDDHSRLAFVNTTPAKCGF